MGNFDGFLMIADYLMSMLAECQPFARHGLGETQAKPPATGNGLSNNKIPYPHSVDMVYFTVHKI
jgi:hypothetical protein